MLTPMTLPQRRRAFTTLFMIEMWERFGYYGMQALILYYMIQRLGFAETRANLVTSAAAALVYATPAIGGLIGDRWLGTQRCIRLGAVILTVGYGLLALPLQSEGFLMVALSVVIVGNGFFKANAGNLLSRIYQNDATALDSASTLYYMAVNVGSTLSMLLTPWVNDVVNAHYGNGLGWHAAFACCAVGLVIGLANWLVTRQTLAQVRSDLDHQRVSLARWGATACHVCNTDGLLYADSVLYDISRPRRLCLGTHRSHNVHRTDCERAASNANGADHCIHSDTANDAVLHLLSADVHITQSVRPA